MVNNDAMYILSTGMNFFTLEVFSVLHGMALVEEASTIV